MTLCPDCQRRGAASPLIWGVALRETLSGAPDDLRGSLVTVSPDGGGALAPCLKCPQCGWSCTP